MRLTPRSISRKKKQFRIACEWFLARISSCFVSEDNLVINHWKGYIDGETEKRFCIFSSYDKHDCISEYVVNYLAHLRDTGFAIIFVSASRNINERDLVRLRSLCAHIVHKKNIGLDFGSWKIGLSFVPKPMEGKSLLLANDSVYGPLFDLREVFAEAEQAKYDVWGITDSWDYQYHVQSYFLFMNESFCSSKAFSKFFDGIRFFRSKTLIIRSYEIGLSQAALRSGFRVGALNGYSMLALEALAEANDKLEQLMQLCPDPHNETANSKMIHDFIFDEWNYYNWIRRAIQTNAPLNASHMFWRTLIEAHRCPFLKIELLRDNPVKVRGLYDWQQVLNRNSNYRTDLITDHLKRICQHPAT